MLKLLIYIFKIFCQTKYYTMNKYCNIVYLFVLIILLACCTRDEIVIPEPPVILSTNGAYILSEGGITPGSSMLSFYSISADSFYADIFNPGTLGLFTDGLIIINKNLYLTEQGNFGSAGKIYKLDTNGTAITSQVTGTNPYSLTTANNKIYITNGPASNVSVLDINNFSLITTINVGAYPQEIISIGNKVFVCNTSIFGGAQDSTVSVIDATTDQIVETIVVQKDPSSLAITNDNKLIVGCPGQFGFAYIIDPDAYNKIDSFLSIDGMGKDIAVDNGSNEIYFISGSNNITKIDIASRVSVVVIANPNPASTFFYGYNFDLSNKKHYVCDARNFTVSGSLYIYDENGTLEQTFTTGIAPRRVVFKID
jgi:YVTN family beta-propeller protein